jgi:hypothetical protein
MRCNLCGGRGDLSWQEDSTPANTGEPAKVTGPDGFRLNLQMFFKRVREPVGEYVFLVTLASGISKGFIRMSQSDLHRLSGSSNLLTGRVTDELVLWLQEEGWLDVPANG